MKKKQVLKSISLVLCMVLLFSTFPIPVTADITAPDVQTPSEADGKTYSSIESESQISNSTLKTVSPQAGEKTVIELQEMQVDLASIPEAIDQAVALEKGHVNRLTAQEDNLSTIIYQNSDGTKSTYLFPLPIKYIDESGTVRDKSSKVEPIVNSLYSHAMLNNSTKVFFPKSAANGTKINFGNYEITMSPKTSTLATPSQKSERNMVYEGVFGKGTALAYNTELNGLKEDIVLYYNVGKSSFEFVLLTEGVTPVLLDGVWCFQNASGALVAKLGSIDVRDSAGNTTQGTISVVSTETRGKYAVTISVADSFLSANATTYPVYVDPTVYIFEEMSYIGPDGYDYPYAAILDTGLYNSEAAKNTALQNPGVHNFGDRGTYQGKIIYKFPGFYDTYTDGTDEYHYSQYLLKASQIGSVTLYFQETNAEEIDLCAYPMTATWDATSVGSNPVALYDPSLWSARSTSIGCYTNKGSPDASPYYTLNVTDIFREWARYNQFERTNPDMVNPYLNPAHGFSIEDFGGLAGNIVSVDAFDTAGVYIVMDTSTIQDISYITNKASGRYLMTWELWNEPLSVKISEYTTSQAITPNFHWELEYLGSNYYYIRSIEYPNYVLYIGSSSVSMVEADRGGGVSTFSCKITTAASGGRLIQNRAETRILQADENLLSSVASTSSNDDPKTIWQIHSSETYVNLQSFSISMPNNDNIIEITDTARHIQITTTPDDANFSGANYFIWESMNTAVAEVDASGCVTGKAVGRVEITATHKITRVKKRMELHVTEKIDNNIYHIVNASTGKVLEVTNNTDGSLIKQGNFDSTSNYQKWSVTYNTDGYYTLKSFATNKYMTFQADDKLEPLYQTDLTTVADAMKWKIVLTSSGLHTLVPLGNTSSNQCISKKGSSEDCWRVTYTDDENYGDEWIFCQIQYYATINSFYDNGYLQKYGYSQNEAEQHIRDFSTTVARKFLTEFGLLIDINTITFYNSPLDLCKGTVTPENVDDPCECDLNHSHMWSVISDFNISHSGSDTVTNIYWTGHSVFWDSTPSRSCSSGTSIFMLETTSNDNLIIRTLAHEISHQYGASDHYHELMNNGICKHQNLCNNCNGANARDSRCIMDGEITNFYDCIVCNGCSEEIKTHLNNHHTYS